MTLKITSNGEDISDKIVFEPILDNSSASTKFLLSDDLTVVNGDSITFTWKATTGADITTTGYVTKSFSGKIRLDFDDTDPDAMLDRIFIDNFVEGIISGRIEV